MVTSPYFEVSIFSPHSGFCLDSPCCYLSNKIGFTSFGVHMQKLSQFLFWCFCFLCTGRYYRAPPGTTAGQQAGSIAPSQKFSRFGTGFGGVQFPQHYRALPVLPQHQVNSKAVLPHPRGSTMGCQVTVQDSKEFCRPVLPDAVRYYRARQ